MEATVKRELAKYTKVTDLVTEVETTTNNHYSLNYRFEVVRDSQKYFIAIKLVDVMGQIKQHHTRLEVDTNLKPLTTKNIDKEEIKKEIEVLQNWFEKHKKFKNSKIWISQEKKLNNLHKKIGA